MTPPIPLMGIHPKDLKTGPQTNACMHMLIATLFIIAKGGNSTNVCQWKKG